MEEIRIDPIKITTFPSTCLYTQKRGQKGLKRLKFDREGEGIFSEVRRTGQKVNKFVSKKRDDLVNFAGGTTVSFTKPNQTPKGL